MENSGPPEKNNGTTTRRYLAREFGSRFRSPIDLSAATTARRSLSPNDRQTVTVSPEKRALSAGRMRPSSIQDVGEKASPEDRSDHSLRQPENAVHKQTEALRNPTPERKINPLNYRQLDPLNYRMLDQHRRPSTTGENPPSDSMKKAYKKPRHESSGNMLSSLPFGKSEKQGFRCCSVDDNSLMIRNESHSASPKKETTQSLSITENSRSLSSLHSQLLDRWPGRTFGKVNSDSLNRVDGKHDRNSGTASLRSSLRARTFTVDGLSKPLQKSLDGGKKLVQNSSKEMPPLLLSLDGEKGGIGFHPIDSQPAQREKTSLVNPDTRSRPISSNRTSTFSSSFPIRVVPPDMKAITSGTSLFLGSRADPSRRLSSDGATEPPQSSSGDMLSIIPSNEHTEEGLGLHLVDDKTMALENLRRLLVSPITRSHPTSPKNETEFSSCVSGVVSPSNAKAIASNRLPFIGPSAPPLQRLSLDGATQPLQKSSDMLSVLTSGESAEGTFDLRSVDDNFLSLQRQRTMVNPGPRSRPTSPNKASALYFSVSRAIPSQTKANDYSLSLQRERTTLVNPGTRSRPTSPNKASALYFSVSRATPSQTKAIPSDPSRGASPSKVRPSSPARRPNPAFNFVVDIRGKDENQIEDAHQLRLLQNRYLQWRYANAKADATIHAENVNTQEMAYSVWRSTSNLWGTIIEMRIELQQLRLELKLHSTLNEQMSYLDKWATIERNYISSVLQASQDMHACILRIPMTGGARGDIQAVMSAVCSSFVMMQYVESSISLMLSQLEGTSFLVSELAGIVAQERAMLDEFQLLMAPIADMQVEECYLRTYLMQLSTDLEKRW